MSRITPPGGSTMTEFARIFPADRALSIRVPERYGALVRTRFTSEVWRSSSDYVKGLLSEIAG